MFLKVKYGEIEGTNVKGVVTGSRPTKLYIVYEVNESNVEECLRAVQLDQNVVQVQYTGELGYLKGRLQEPTFLALVDKRLTYEIAVNNVDEELYLMLQTELPQQLTVVLNLPAFYNNMRELVGMSMKHPNVRLVGGQLLRIEGMRIGSIDVENLPKRISESKIPYVTEGKTGIHTVYELKEVVDFEYVKEKEKKVKVSKPKEPKVTTPKEKVSKPKENKRKQAINSLLALQESVGNNF